MKRFTILVLLCSTLFALAVDNVQPRRGGSRQTIQGSNCNDVPAHLFDLILGRPTLHSVTVSVLCYHAAEGFIAFGTQPDKLTRSTPKRAFQGGEPAEVVLSGLLPDTQYFYQLRLSPTNSSTFAFHTARPPGGSFDFTITADSHLDEQTDPAVYLRSLAAALANAPDFHIDLGDTFMTGKHPGREAAARQYLSQRFYFGRLCSSAPLFLVLGNHDGENPSGPGSDSDDLAGWSNLMRKRYFPNPVPDGFYSGNQVEHERAGLLQDYYSWTWGDALFVVLDPFWFSPRSRRNDDNWFRTLGRGQYDWLKRTLETSRAKYKFIFIHHLVGGADRQGRGGVEAASLCEWGGRNPDGSDGFAERRPGWAMPIHQMLVTNHVSAVFHGHDHLFVRQELDGILYQEVPQPGDPRGNTRSAAEYGYKSGTLLGSSGCLRVTVSAEKADVEYVRTGGAGARPAAASVAHCYSITPPRGPGQP